MSDHLSQSYSSYSTEEALLMENPRGEYITEEIMDHSGGSYYEDEFMQDEEASSFSDSTGSQSESYQSEVEGVEEESSSSIIEALDESSAGEHEMESEHTFAQETYAESYRVEEVVAASPSVRGGRHKIHNPLLKDSFQQNPYAHLSMSPENNNSSLYHLGSVKWSDDDETDVSLLTGDSPSVVTATPVNLLPRWDDADDSKRSTKQPPSSQPGNIRMSVLDGNGDDDTDDEDEEEELIANDLSNSSYAEEEELLNEDKVVKEEDPPDTRPVKPQRQVSIAADSHSSLFSSGTMSSALETESFLHLIRTVEEEDSTNSYPEVEDADLVVLTNSVPIPEPQLFAENQVPHDASKGSLEGVVRHEDLAADAIQSGNNDASEAIEERQQEGLTMEMVSYPDASESTDLDTETHSLSQRSGSIYGSDVEEVRAMRLREAKVNGDGFVTLSGDDSASSWDDDDGIEGDEFFEADEADDVVNVEVQHDKQHHPVGGAVLDVIDEQPAESEDDLDRFMAETKELVEDGQEHKQKDEIKTSNEEDEPFVEVGNAESQWETPADKVDDMNLTAETEELIDDEHDITSSESKAISSDDEASEVFATADDNSRSQSEVDNRSQSDVDPDDFGDNEVTDKCRSYRSVTTPIPKLRVQAMSASVSDSSSSTGQDYDSPLDRFDGDIVRLSDNTYTVSARFDGDEFNCDDCELNVVTVTNETAGKEFGKDVDQLTPDLQRGAQCKGEAESIESEGDVDSAGPEDVGMNSKSVLAGKEDSGPESKHVENRYEANASAKSVKCVDSGGDASRELFENVQGFDTERSSGYSLRDQAGGKCAEADDSNATSRPSELRETNDNSPSSFEQDCAALDCKVTDVDFVHPDETNFPSEKNSASDLSRVAKADGDNEDISSESAESELEPEREDRISADPVNKEAFQVSENHAEEPVTFSDQPDAFQGTARSYQNGEDITDDKKTDEHSSLRSASDTEHFDFEQGSEDFDFYGCISDSSGDVSEAGHEDVSVHGEEISAEVISATHRATSGTQHAQQDYPWPGDRSGQRGDLGGARPMAGENSVSLDNRTADIEYIPAHLMHVHVNSTSDKKESAQGSCGQLQATASQTSFLSERSIQTYGSQNSFLNSFQSEDIILLDDELSDDEESNGSQELTTVISSLIQHDDLQPINEMSESSSECENTSDHGDPTAGSSYSSFPTYIPPGVPRSNSFSGVYVPPCVPTKSSTLSEEFHVVSRVSCATAPSEDNEGSRDIVVDFRNDAILEEEGEEESNSLQSGETQDDGRTADEYGDFVNNDSDGDDSDSESGAAYPDFVNNAMEDAPGLISGMFYDNCSFDDPEQGSEKASDESSQQEVGSFAVSRSQNSRNESTSSSKQKQKDAMRRPEEVIWTPTASKKDDLLSTDKTAVATDESSLDVEDEDYNASGDISSSSMSDDIETGIGLEMAPGISSQNLLKPEPKSRKRRQRKRPKWFLPLLISIIGLTLLVLLVVVPVVWKNKKSSSESPENQSDDAAPSPTSPGSPQDNANERVPTIPPDSRLSWITKAVMQFSNDSAFGASAVILDDMVAVGDPLGSYVKIFIENSSKGWLELADLYGDQVDSRFGTSISIANQRMVVGAPLTYAEGTEIPTGAAFFYVYNQLLSTWQSLGAVLRGEDDILISSGEDFGASVAVSDAFRVVVGAPKNSLSALEAGRVYTFELSRKTDEQFPLVGESAGDLFGFSVAVSKDGFRFIGGAPGTSVGSSSDGRGYVRVYYWLGTSWQVLGVIRGQEDREAFGSSVASLSDSGEVIAVGAPGFRDGAGRIAVFKLDLAAGEYRQLGPDIIGKAGDSLGTLGTLAGEVGSEGPIVVASTLNGEVMRFDYHSESERWRENYQPVSNEHTGMSTVAFSVSKKGTEKLLVSVPSFGMIMIYEASVAAPTETPMLSQGSESEPTDVPTVADAPAVNSSTTARPSTNTPSAARAPPTASPVVAGKPTLPPGTWLRSGGPFTGISGTAFGSSVSLTENILAVGAPNGTSPGVVSIFGQNAGDWFAQPMQQLTGTQTGGLFGAAIDMKGEELLIGAPKVYAEGTLTSAGAAYYHIRNTDGSWLQLGSVMTGASGLYATSEDFGASVSTSDIRRVAIGAPGNSEELQYQRGKVYVFDYDSELDEWTRIQDIAGSKVAERFGSSVALSSSGNFLVVGSPTGTGSATIYQYNPASWFSISTIQGEDENEAMGSSVVMLNDEGTLVAVGAPGYADGSGRVLVYQRDGSSGRFSPFGSPIIGGAGERIGAKNKLSGFGLVVFSGTATGIVRRYAYLSSTASWESSEVDSGTSNNLWAISSSPTADGFAAGGAEQSNIWTQA